MLLEPVISEFVSFSKIKQGALLLSLGLHALWFGMKHKLCKTGSEVAQPLISAFLRYQALKPVAH